MGKKVYVKNIPFNLTEQDIKDIFAEFGEVESVKIITDAHTGQSKGFGFVEMELEADVKKAIAAVNGKTFLGRTLTVAEARPQQPKYGPDGKRTPFGRGSGQGRSWG